MITELDGGTVLPGFSLPQLFAELNRIDSK